MKKTRRGPVLKPSIAPIVISTLDIAEYSGNKITTVRSWISRGTLDIQGQKTWHNFWTLVLWLEYKGLRPEAFRMKSGAELATTSTKEIKAG